MKVFAYEDAEPTPLQKFFLTHKEINVSEFAKIIGINASLLRNLFYNKAPLHDGAVVISEGRIAAAGCFLNLTRRSDVDQDLGTRHRAALGASETSDAIVVIVSEESGMISIAQGGVLSRNLTVDKVGERLREALFEKEETVKKHQAFWENIINKQKKEEKNKDE